MTFQNFPGCVDTLAQVIGILRHTWQPVQNKQSADISNVSGGTV
jgi:hypothetical protein